MITYNFTNGAFLNPIDDVLPHLAYEQKIFKNCVVAYSIAGGNYISNFPSPSTDYNGNIWKFENGIFTLSIKGSSTIRWDMQWLNTWASIGTAYVLFCEFNGTKLRFSLELAYINNTLLAALYGDNNQFLEAIKQKPTNSTGLWKKFDILCYAGIITTTGQPAPFLRSTSGGLLLSHINKSVVVEPDPPPETDPFAPGGTSGTGGGGGGFTGHSDPIPIPPLPSIDAGTTGFVTLFGPTAEQLRSLSSYMWSDLFDISGWRKIMANPMDCILGLSIVPVPHSSAVQKEVKVGGVGTGIYLDLAGTQFQEIDCGSIEIKEYWGSYLDYSPYTKFELTLPYIGTHAINADDVMEKTVAVKYHVDILSGACVAYVLCGESVLYSFAGQCSCQIPITGNDWSNALSGALAIAGSIGAMVATSGLSAPLSAGALVAGGASIAGTVMASKPQVEKSGAMGGTAGMMAVQKPYFTVTRPRQALPKYQNKFLGYPAFITSKLGDLTGFTVVEQIHIENTWATGEELTELEALCKSGIII